MVSQVVTLCKLPRSNTYSICPRMKMILPAFSNNGMIPVKGTP